MKKSILCTLLIAAVLLAAWCAAGEEDLAGMTYDELIALQDSMNLRIWKGNNWRRVTVPEGVYTVGVDIPEGEYQIINLPDEDVIMELAADGRETETVYCLGDYGHAVLTNGMQVYVMDGPAVFCPENFKLGFRENDVTTPDVEPMKTLSRRIQEQLRALNNWQTVKIPTGLWTIGKQFPTGKWTLWPSAASYSSIFYGGELDERGLPDGSDEIDGNAFISDPAEEEDAFKYRDRYSFEAKDGWYLYIEHSPVICTPYTGKPLFGFEN